MNETFGGGRSEQEQFHKLNDAMEEEGNKIDHGIDVSAVQLDRYLFATVAFYRWKVQQRYAEDLNAQASNGEQVFRFQHVLNGTYQKEKATFALEEAQFYRKEAEDSSNALEIDFTDEEEPEATRAGIKRGFENYNTYAANWLRTAANCLEMPEPRPSTAPNEEQQ